MSEPRLSRFEAIDSLGRLNLLLRSNVPLNQQHKLSDAVADEVVRRLRSYGMLLWLAQEGPNVRLRGCSTSGIEPPARLVDVIGTYSRTLAKAVARLGEDDPPPGNVYGDTPHRGGKWVFEGDDE